MRLEHPWRARTAHRSCGRHDACRSYFDHAKVFERRALRPRDRYVEVGHLNDAQPAELLLCIGVRARPHLRRSVAGTDRGGRLWWFDAERRDEDAGLLWGQPRSEQRSES